MVVEYVRKKLYINMYISNIETSKRGKKVRIYRYRNNQYYQQYVKKKNTKNNNMGKSIRSKQKENGVESSVIKYINH